MPKNGDDFFRREPELWVPRPRPSRAFGVGFVLWFVFCGAVGLGSLGVLIWAIITWITS
ncbi:hypothetical protein [Nocardiopsis synnemataformans]|uniref:hypothetical protein n=1 Tax=Nocardiopsis synnemataformans TaxID=61305 RepID=UPI003EBD6CE7